MSPDPRVARPVVLDPAELAARDANARARGLFYGFMLGGFAGVVVGFLLAAVAGMV